MPLSLVLLVGVGVGHGCCGPRLVHTERIEGKSLARVHECAGSLKELGRKPPQYGVLAFKPCCVNFILEAFLTFPVSKGKAR